MNNTRRKNEPPLDDIESDDFMVSNQFVRGTSVNDLSINDKNNFRNYHKNNEISKDEETSNIVRYDKETIISIDTVDRDIDTYPNPNQVTIPFGESFHNVKQIKLISTEFTNTDKVIQDKPMEIKNNTITWENLDQDLMYRASGKHDINSDDISNTADTVIINLSKFSVDINKYKVFGDYFISIFNCTFTLFNGRRQAFIQDGAIHVFFEGGIPSSELTGFYAEIDIGKPNYTAEIKPGNYDILSLANELQTKMNLVQRDILSIITSTEDLTPVLQFHYFTVDADVNTDVITFTSYIINEFVNYFPISTVKGSTEIKVISAYHTFIPGDKVLMIGVDSSGGLSSTVLNGLFTVLTTGLGFFTYEVNVQANETKRGGGFNVKTGIPDKFRFLSMTGLSRISNVMGFPYEDSSQYIGAVNPIRTKTLKINDAIISGDYVRFITTTPHGLKQATVVEISSISTEGKVITSTPHGIKNGKNIYLYGTNFPGLDGEHSVIVTGNSSFNLKNISLPSIGTSGYVKHGGDRVKLINFKSSPQITLNKFLVENTTNTSFEILFKVTYIDPSSIQDTVIGTGQVFVTHPAHGFLEITSIRNSSAGSALFSAPKLISTSTRHNLSGVTLTSSLVINIIDGARVGTVTFIPNSGISSLNPFTEYLKDGDLIAISGGLKNVIKIISGTELLINIIISNLVDTPVTSVFKGNLIDVSFTNSNPSMDTSVYKHRVITTETGETDFEIKGFSAALPEIIDEGTTGIVGRPGSHRVSINRVTGDKKIGGIPLQVINGHYHDISVIDEDTYMFRLDHNFAEETVSAGGNNVVVSSSLHGYRNSQSNTFNGQKEGKLFKSISLEGQKYVLLSSPNLNSILQITRTGTDDIFAKLLLNKLPGSVMFDSFISAPKIFNPPLSFLKEIELEVKRKDGVPFDLGNIDYSLTISIIESVDRIKTSEVSARTGRSGLY